MGEYTIYLLATYVKVLITCLIEHCTVELKCCSHVLNIIGEESQSRRICYRGSWLVKTPESTVITARCSQRYTAPEGIGFQMIVRWTNYTADVQIYTNQTISLDSSILINVTENGNYEVFIFGIFNRTGIVYSTLEYYNVVPVTTNPGM